MTSKTPRARVICVASLLALLVPWVAAAGDHTQAGAEALGPFKRALKQALQSGMQEGPVNAVGACNTKAPGIAEAASDKGIRVGRASHKLRNPDNTAPAWVQPILDAYLADAGEEPGARAPRSVDLDDGRRGYVEPILLQPMCLTCHGSTLAPDVAARIEALYPDDQATGFEVGDLRGVFWVELPPAS